MPDVTAFLLAGGRSSRMGEDKAFLAFEGRTLLSHALARLREVSPAVVIVGPRAKYSAFGDVVEDVYRDCGPLGGIHAALASAATEWNLLLAVDTPFVTTAFLRYLVGQAHAAPEALVTLPRLDDRWQPLCAVYRKGFVTHAEAALQAGRYKIDAIFASVHVRAIDEEEMRRFAFDCGMFDNLNTLEDWQRATRRVSTR
jgi:molybdopterin-guanine dinucleotide biosynthesis protein A